MAKPKPTSKPKPALHTWQVNVSGNYVRIEGDDIDITDAGVLLFSRGGDIVQAIAHGHWVTVELLEPEVVV